MLSASGGYPPQQTGYGYGGYPPTGYGSMPYGYSAGPSFQPVAMPAYNPGVALSGPNITVKTNPVDFKDVAPLMWGNVGVQALAVVGGIYSQWCAKETAIKSMQVQGDIAQKYYQTQDNIASYQKEVAVKQLGVQGQAIDAQVQMHREQCEHEQEMAKLEGSTAARLAYIGEQGKIQRAKIYATTEAFSRTSWEMGAPIAA